MKILDIKTLNGPNYWSVRHKNIQIKLDLEQYEDLPTDRIEGFYSRLLQHLPGLKDHYCSEGQPGGFMSRVKKGTWLGHVIEHVALEIQTMAGLKCNFGRTRNAGGRGIYFVVFEYEILRAGLYAAEASISITKSLAEGNHIPIENDIEVLRQIIMEDQPGLSTTAILKSARERNIPIIPLGDNSFYQLGYGKAMRRIQATITDLTSSIAVDLSCNKQKTKDLLGHSSIPVAQGMLISDESMLEEAIHNTGFPVVVKPNNRNQGKGVTIQIHNYEQALNAFREARNFSDEILVEKQYMGNDFRLLIINYKLIAAAKRTPALVEGNDILTIRELIENENLNPKRGLDHDNVLTRINIDKSTEKVLQSQLLTLNDVPPKGKIIHLKHTANLSTGGTSEDVTELVHPAVAAMAERVARLTGLDICGIDYISNNISMPPEESGGVIIEVNAAPGFRMHTHPVKGSPRPVGEAVVDMLFPNKQNGRIPIVAVTGTNGKTSTTRLLAHILKTAGYKTGYTTTDGIYINDVCLEEGDCSGPNSAIKILKDRSVEFAVFETARGGLLRSGLAFDSCDVAIVTNIAEDHLGLEGIQTIEEMAHVKSVVPETVHPNGYAILNADDELTYTMKNQLKCRIALFSINSHNKYIKNHYNNGGLAAVLKEGSIHVLNGNISIFSESVANIPISFNGRAGFMIENIMAAALAAVAQNIDIQSILNALRTFSPNMNQMPGRLNLISFNQFNVIIDYAHNFHGIVALGNFVKQIRASQKIGIVTIPGDRREVDIFNFGRASGDIFNQIIIRLDKDTRGRKDTEIIDILHSGIRASRNKNITVEIIPDELEALQYAIRNVTPDSIIIHLAEDITAVHNLVVKLQQRENQLEKVPAVNQSDGYILKVGKNQVYEYTKPVTNAVRK